MCMESTDANNNRMFGNYIAMNDPVENKYNFRINENRYYDRDIQRPSQKYNELANVLGKPLQVPTQLYSFQSDSNKSRNDNLLNAKSFYVGQIEGHAQPDHANAGALENDMRGKQHAIGVDLTTSGFNVLGNGKKIGNKPIIYQLEKTRTSNRHNQRNLRMYANVERVINIKNGDVSVSA